MLAFLQQEDEENTKLTQETQLQKKVLDIYKVFRSICEEKGWRYYAIGGTCLGAVRHKGFIPWDDDIDIAMPRPDYEAFKDFMKDLKARRELEEKIQIDAELFHRLSIVDLCYGTHYFCYFMKLQDEETTLVESVRGQYRDQYMGINIDIMPLDGLPNNSVLRFKHFKELEFFRGMDYHTKFGLFSKLKHLNPNFYMRCYERVQKKYSYEKTIDLCYSWSPRRAKVVFSKAALDEKIELPFEDTVVWCPKGYDEFLTAVYDENYMILPPEEKRCKVHEADILDFEKSFRFYMNQEEI